MNIDNIELYELKIKNINFFIESDHLMQNMSKLEGKLYTYDFPK